MNQPLSPHLSLVLRSRREIADLRPLIHEIHALCVHIAFAEQGRALPLFAHVEPFFQAVPVALVCSNLTVVTALEAQEVVPVPKGVVFRLSLPPDHSEKCLLALQFCLDGDQNFWIGPIVNGSRNVIQPEPSLVMQVLGHQPFRMLLSARFKGGQ